MATIQYVVNAVDAASATFARIAGSADDLLAKMDDLDHKSATARVGLTGDKEAIVTIDQIDLKMARLAKRVAKPGITVEGLAAAKVQLDRFNLELDKLNHKHVDVKIGVDRSLMSRLAGGGSSTGALGGLSGLMGSSLPAGTPLLGGMSLTTLVPLIVAAGAALLLLTPAIVGTGVALAGMAGFAAAAIPVVTNLTGSLSTLHTATSAYQAASASLNTAIHKSPADLAAYQATIHGLEPDLRNAAKLLTNQNVTWQNLSPSMQRSAVALFNNKAAYGALLPSQKSALTALLSEKTAWDKLSPAQQGIAKDMQSLGGQFSKLEKTIQPFVLQAFATGLKIIKDLMPAFQPLLVAAGKALDAFLGKMDSWLKSPSGQKFVHWLETTGPADIATLGKALWGIANVFGQVILFMYRTGHDGINRIKTAFKFFTVDVPNIFQVMNDKVKIWFDQIVIGAGHTVLDILGFFTHIPGPIGSNARKAADQVKTQLDRMKTDAHATALSMQTSLDRLHGKTVQVTLIGKGGGKITVSSSVKNAAGFLEFHAAGGLIRGGTPGRDSVLAALMPGEVVVPASMVSAGAVEHLRGRLPGFAAGGFVSAADAIGSQAVPFAGGKEHTFGLALAQPFGQSLLTVFQAAISAAIAAAKAAAAGPAISGGGGPAAALFRRMYPAWAGGARWTAVNYVAMRESGWNTYAANPTSSARGVAQRIQGWAPFYQPGNAFQQDKWFHDYMLSRYGGPIGAAQHERAFNWYGGGLSGGVFTRPTLIGVGDTPERVDITPLGRGGGGRYYTVNVNVAPGANLGEVGRVTVEAIKAFERRSGPGWRK